MLHFMKKCIYFWHDHHLILLLRDLFTFWMTSLCVCFLWRSVCLYFYLHGEFNCIIECCSYNHLITDFIFCRAQLLRVLETRKTVLRKEQAMAFARAVAAGFDIDNLVYLITFAECFGASRLM